MICQGFFLSCVELCISGLYEQYIACLIYKRRFEGIGHSLCHEHWVGMVNSVPPSPSSASLQRTLQCVLAGEKGTRLATSTHSSWFNEGPLRKTKMILIWLIIFVDTLTKKNISANITFVSKMFICVKLATWFGFKVQAVIMLAYKFTCRSIQYQHTYWWKVLSSSFS